jgi:hypothetical protein
MATFGSFVTGQVITSAELNATGAWTAFTPTWTNVTQGTAPSNTGQYSLFNKILFFRCKLVLGTGGVLTGAATLTVPASQTLAVTPTMTWIPTVQAVGIDSGVNSYTLGVAQASTTTMSLYVQTASGTYLTNTTTTNATVPFTWGLADSIEVAGFVQVA